VKIKLVVTGAIKEVNLWIALQKEWHLSKKVSTE
jgi:hypothetical protein